ncbi:MAG: hypothetical protein HOJ95_01890 [Nitrospinaceae bacterium]|jgi:16S rRNA (cytosine967-C5)-methyltransferase|nr:hypothetical protein [Nitrospinaceae bacterium]MBT3434597.1 hypothetical protein [Nitrospinaceae bacterium]MBT4094664.1 hypothetical protein [Nitrospinaceae bacterium]MBT5366926.1 hypothetical protein [Nitrospinaceae bacterium]MBT5946412.1 hypothetical protein [Nitrospinaceae bacterium]
MSKEPTSGRKRPARNKSGKPKKASELRGAPPSEKRRPEKKKSRPPKNDPVKITPGTGADPVREAVHKALVAFGRRPTNAENLLERFTSRDFKARDRAFFHELLYGTLRWRGRIDASYERFLSEPPDRLSSGVREALRLGVYQIMFMDRVPDHGAVNTSVYLAGQDKGRGARGLVNAVLRRVLREPLRPPKAIKDRLTIWESHPSWLVQRWITQLGPEATRARCEANNTEGPVVFRANPWQGSAARLADILGEGGIATEPGKVDPDSLWMKPKGGGGQPSFSKSGAYKAGAFIIQDEASSMAARFSGVGSGQRVLDVCAAPGGKTAVMAWMAGKRGRIVAADNTLGRLGRLKINCDRIGVPVRVLAMDAGKPAFGDVFDTVFVDAPCSGAGVIRRHPDARWRLRENDFGRHGEAQRKLLAAASSAVKPGGALIYSVCSNEPEETDEVASSIDGAKFVREPAVDSLPAAAREFVGADGALRLLPEGGRGLDGFFTVRWRRV